MGTRRGNGRKLQLTLRVCQTLGQDFEDGQSGWPILGEYGMATDPVLPSCRVSDLLFSKFGTNAQTSAARVQAFKLQAFSTSLGHRRCSHESIWRLRALVLMRYH